ncbi:hypothetical protein M9H77_34371 [Catharanthus roseus]|uniref:Uncharacterized protein n=1 Tax=Catharanthus roseus TaxID=4058 RepID=A0ACB9ZL00_CATRO|nr:hypothetical protein M9H77_34371 [Catharanthus roseus]
MNIRILNMIVKGSNLTLQMDKLLPRRLNGGLISPITDLSHYSSRSILFFSLCSPSSTTDFYSSFQKAHRNFSQSIMGGNDPQGTEEAKKVQQKHKKEVCGDFSNDILPRILNIYGSRGSPQDFEIYAPNATFEDPLMRAEGIKQIKSAFYSLSKVFSESRIVEYNINENVISPGKKEINIDNKQYYKFLGKDIHMVSLIKLQMENGKIVRHEDWWDKKPLWNRETVKLPPLGRMTEITRRASMLATHALMGFGKDPTK